MPRPSPVDTPKVVFAYRAAELAASCDNSWQTTDRHNRWLAQNPSELWWQVQDSNL